MEVISGKVIPGKQQGRKQGFPTANIAYTKKSLNAGTYRSNVQIGDTIHKAATVVFPDRKLSETHILTFQGDLYGQEIDIYILYKIRDNKQLPVRQLQRQIQQDIHHITTTQQQVLTFGTFDLFHPGHRYYLEQSRLWGDNIVTIIARDHTVKRLKGIRPTHTEITRQQKVQKRAQATHPSHKVYLGYKNNYMQVIQDYIPDMIVLGYDQTHLQEKLLQYLENNAIHAQIKRVPSYDPHIYKSSILRKNTNI